MEEGPIDIQDQIVQSSEQQHFDALDWKGALGPVKRPKPETTGRKLNSACRQANPMGKRRGKKEDSNHSLEACVQ
jgi:hypothetical protein